MPEFRKKIESLSSTRALVVGVIVGVLVSTSAFYGFESFRPEAGGTENAGSIEVKGIQMVSSRIGSGQESRVSVRVKNMGKGAKTRSLKLRVDGNVKKTKDVTLASGENTQISFVFREKNLGNHTLKIGGLAKTFEVLEHGLFTSKMYGFSLKYPTDWTLNKRQSRTGLGLALKENKTGGLRPKAQAQVSVQKVTQRTPSLENLQKTISNQIENNENLAWISKPKVTETDNIRELNLAVKSKSARGNFIIKQRAIRGKKYQYSVRAFANENNYETYKEDLNMIIENLKLEK